MATMIAANWVNEYIGTSDEAKPNDQYVPNGSTYYEMDTSSKYMFHRTNKAGGSWLKQASSGGGGGGGEEEVFYDTQAGWDAQPDLVGIQGAIYVTRDYATITPAGGGEPQDVPGIRVGDGVTLLKDLPYMNAGSDKDRAVTTEDVDNWNNKVSAEVSDIDGENLILGTG